MWTRETSEEGASPPQLHPGEIREKQQVTAGRGAASRSASALGAEGPRFEPSGRWAEESHSVDPRDERGGR